MRTIDLRGLYLDEAAERLVAGAPARGDYFGIGMRARYATTRARDVVAQYRRALLVRTLCYGNQIPRGMRERLVCGSCGGKDCRLWREYNTFADHTRILCARCAAADQGKDARELGSSDQIGWMVPAVPTHDGTFWGYTSVPPEGVAWWQGLPVTLA